MQDLKTFMLHIATFIIQPLVALLVTAAVAYFIWGVATFIWNSDKADERNKGTQHLLWGVVGILIIVSVIGIIQIALATFGCHLTSGFASCP